MVVFTCNHCGDSLQKPRVEKHYNFVCRTRKSLTCIDCLKDFLDEDYAGHTKCLTEEERYAAKGAYANGIVKKGEIKQESWLEMIKSILVKETNLKPSVRNLLNTISNSSNVPRKKPKFMNFVKSSSGGRANMKDVEEVWDVIENYKASQNKSKDQDVQQNGGEPSNSADNVEACNNDDSEVNKTDKKDSKKKKKKDQDICDQPNEEKVENSPSESTEAGVKKTKKKKHNLKSENTVVAEEISQGTTNGEVESKKHKKSKKSSINSEGIQENEKIEDNKTFEEQVENSLTESKEEGVKKSKKRKHNLEAENTSVVEEISQESTNGEVGSKKNKKSKKSVINSEDVKENGKTEDNVPIKENVENLFSESTEEGMKKTKKRKHALETENAITTEEVIQENGELKRKKSKKSKESIGAEADEENGTNGDILNDSSINIVNDAETPNNSKLDSTNDEVEAEDQNVTKEKFDFQRRILEVLGTKGNTTVRKIEKKVTSAYLKYSGLSEVSPKILKKFNKKLRSLENVEIVDNIIKLKPTV